MPVRTAGTELQPASVAVAVRSSVPSSVSRSTSGAPSGDRVVASGLSRLVRCGRSAQQVRLGRFGSAGSARQVRLGRFGSAGSARDYHRATHQKWPACRSLRHRHRHPTSRPTARMPDPPVTKTATPATELAIATPLAESAIDERGIATVTIRGAHSLNIIGAAAIADVTAAIATLRARDGSACSCCAARATPSSEVPTSTRWRNSTPTRRLRSSKSSAALC